MLLPSMKKGGIAAALDHFAVTAPDQKFFLTVKAQVRGLPGEPYT